MLVAEFDRLVALNVGAPNLLVQKLLTTMCRGSAIILTSSLMARAVVGDFSAYAATKGATDALVKHFAFALGHRGIRVNAIAPGHDHHRLHGSSPHSVVVSTSISEYCATRNEPAATLEATAPCTARRGTQTGHGSSLGAPAREEYGGGDPASRARPVPAVTYPPPAAGAPSSTPSRYC